VYIVAIWNVVSGLRDGEINCFFNFFCGGNYMSGWYEKKKQGFFFFFKSSIYYTGVETGRGKYIVPT